MSRLSSSVAEALLALGIVALISTMLLTINWSFWRPSMGPSTVIEGDILGAYGAGSVSIYCNGEHVIASYAISNSSVWKDTPKEYVASHHQPLTIPVSGSADGLVMSPLEREGVKNISSGECVITLNPDIRVRVLIGLALALTLISVYTVLRIKHSLPVNAGHSY